MTNFISSWLETPLGQMFAIADDQALYFLDFFDGKGFDRKITHACQQAAANLQPGSNVILTSLETQLTAYFNGELQQFNLPLAIKGSAFQQQVWNGLLTIPYGQTKSYKELAKLIGNPRASRAVGSANGANHFAVVIPCHRVIANNGGLGGYGGGLSRKEWLLVHERE